uniref:G1 to S phase transition protein n=1 Tax=Schistosoma japonicum TaxID=6182 RepID=C1LN28_SCHJA|nr:G1 to S phase transition protein [Schistosoma japonicum]
MASWEDQLGTNGPVTSKFSQLDVNAPEFVPGEPFVYKPVKVTPIPVCEPYNQPLISDDLPEEETEAGPEKDGDAPKKTIAIAPDKDTLNLVFIGHVDAGKSTTGGHLLYLTDMVDKRTLEKYEREAKEKNRESWYLSWALDTNPEERDKGKTVECGRAYFETQKKRFVLIDAPGHKSFVPNMISGAAVADIAILVISARRGEFETGFDKGGQTREHALLVKTAGVKHLIVLVNKMDDPTVLWDETRYIECKDKIIPYLKKIGFNTKNDVYCMPCSGYDGSFLRDIPNESSCPWYRGPSLLEYLDSLPSFSRKTDGPLRLPVTDRYKDMGTYASGKVESGSVSKGQTVVLLPNKLIVEIMQVYVGDVEVNCASAGEHCKLKLRNIDEEDISPGFCFCSTDNFCQVSNLFDAQLLILDYKSIICPGFMAVLHIHTCMKEVRLRTIICRLDKKTNQKAEVHPRFIRKDDAAIVRLEVLGGPICLETFQNFSQLGRFTLRDEGKTVAIGKVVKILNPIDCDQ